MTSTQVLGQASHSDIHCCWGDGRIWNLDFRDTGHWALLGFYFCFLRKQLLWGPWGKWGEGALQDLFIHLSSSRHCPESFMLCLCFVMVMMRLLTFVLNDLSPPERTGTSWRCWSVGSESGPVMSGLDPHFHSRKMQTPKSPSRLHPFAGCLLFGLQL